MYVAAYTLASVIYSSTRIASSDNHSLDLCKSSEVFKGSTSSIGDSRLLVFDSSPIAFVQSDLASGAPRWTPLTTLSRSSALAAPYHLNIQQVASRSLSIKVAYALSCLSQCYYSSM